MIEFQIQYLGKDEVVEIEDDIPIGVLEDVMKRHVPMDVFSIDVANGQPNISVDLSKINVVGYRHDLTVKCVKKAPWSLEAFSEVPQSVATQVMGKVMELYPPMDFLASFMESIAGGATKEKKPRRK